MNELIERTVTIEDTPVGYDIIVFKRTRMPDYRLLARRYKNISTATMERFLNLSGNRTSVTWKKAIDRRMHFNIFLKSE